MQSALTGRGKVYLSKFVVRVKAVIDHFWRRSNYSPVFFKRLPFRLKVSWRIRVVASKYSLWSSVSVCSWFASIVFCTCNISSCRWRNSMHGEVRKLTLYYYRQSWHVSLERSRPRTENVLRNQTFHGNNSMYCVVPGLLFPCEGVAPRG